MEPARIDWNRVESIFVEEEMYEHINAPKWIDLLAADEASVEDCSWFCKPDCNHPQKAEDFRQVSPVSKLSISAERSETLLGSWNQRDKKLKRRGHNHYSPKPKEEENQDPNVSTPQVLRAKSAKEPIKSSADRKNNADDDSPPGKEPRRLKSTMSASNLFGGKNILIHLSEFYNELKKKTFGAREKQLSEVNAKTEDIATATENSGTGIEKTPPLHKPRKRIIRREEDAENIPVSLNFSPARSQLEKSSPKIRTKPPPPQRFSTTVEPKITPTKSTKSRFMERGILQEVKQTKSVRMLDESRDGGGGGFVPEGRETRGHDVFWFLKPCTLAS